MSGTYQINEGVRRAKAAQLAGHQTIWAQIGDSSTEQRVPIGALYSPKKVIDVRSPGELERWQGIKHGMTQEPDLFPPIHILPGGSGTPIHQVKVIGEPI